VTKFLDKSFSSRPASQEYRDNYDRTFGKTPAKEEKRETLHKFECGDPWHLPQLPNTRCQCKHCGQSEGGPLHIKD